MRFVFSVGVAGSDFIACMRSEKNFCHALGAFFGFSPTEAAGASCSSAALSCLAHLVEDMVVVERWSKKGSWVLWQWGRTKRKRLCAHFRTFLLSETSRLHRATEEGNLAAPGVSLTSFAFARLGRPDRSRTHLATNRAERNVFLHVFLHFSFAGPPRHTGVFVVWVLSYELAVIKARAWPSEAR